MIFHSGHGISGPTFSFLETACRTATTDNLVCPASFHPMATRSDGHCALLWLNLFLCIYIFPGTDPTAISAILLMSQDPIQIITFWLN